jgi:hypothetical protein
MKQWIKRITGVTAIEAEVLALKAQREQEQAKLEKLQSDQKKTQRQKTTPKERATKAKEPYIDIVKVDLDENNPSYGSFELDWNEYFVKKLRDLGYPGESDEVVVDLWFQSVCRNILMETYEQEAANRSDNIRYISRRDLGDGKTEVS